MRCLNLLKPKHWERYFDKNPIDAILAEHVWEHLTLEEGLVAAKQCYQYLKPGGYLRMAVPDGFHPDPEYIEKVKINGIDPGSEDHKVLYNHKTLSNIFEKAGFKVDLLEYFDSNKEFHGVNWDEGKGMILRSKKHDKRNKNGILKYTSIVLDAKKPLS
jgi:predicted SAM-dependent methyltransferase